MPYQFDRIRYNERIQCLGGFCLFETVTTGWKVTNTSFGRDIVAEFLEAFRAEGLCVGLYYSLLDWHHPDFP